MGSVEERSPSVVSFHSFHHTLLLNSCLSLSTCLCFYILWKTSITENTRLLQRSLAFQCWKQKSFQCGTKNYDILSSSTSSNNLGFFTRVSRGKTRQNCFVISQKLQVYKNVFTIQKLKLVVGFFFYRYVFLIYIFSIFTYV